MGNESAHTSFYNPNESSILSSVPSRRRSIRESQYESLLRSETKRVSTYSDLFQDSEILSASVAERSLFRPSPSVVHQDSSPSIVHQDSTKSLDSSTLSAASISHADTSLDHQLSHLSSRLSEVNEASKSSLSPSMDESVKKELIMREQQEPVEIEPASFDEETPTTLTSQEETVIRNLLSSQPDEPSQVQMTQSYLEDSMMPPPTQSLRSKLRIPLKGLSRAGRKKGQKNDEWMMMCEVMCRDVIIPYALVKRLVTASCGRRIGKDVFPMINSVTSDFFEVSKWTENNVQTIADRLDDYCHLGKRDVIQISDVALLMKRQRLINERQSFEDLAREHLNKQQIDSIIDVPEWKAKINEMGSYLQ